MRKIKIVRTKASKLNMSRYEQLQNIKNATKSFLKNQFKHSFNCLPKNIR